jgi:hypothetical protein
MLSYPYFIVLLSLFINTTAQSCSQLLKGAEQLHHWHYIMVSLTATVSTIRQHDALSEVPLPTVKHVLLISTHEHETTPDHTHSTGSVTIDTDVDMNSAAAAECGASTYVWKLN